MTTAEPPPSVTECIARSILLPVVEILVGGTEIAFHIHSDLLCQTSDYFRACLQGNFIQATKGEVKLPETRAETFQYFIKWLYTGDLAPFDSSHTHLSIFKDMTDVFALGTNLFCEGLRNRAVDMIQEVCTEDLLNAERIVYVAQAVESRSLLMQYLIQQLSFDMVEEGYAELVEDDAWLTFIAMDARMTSDLMCKLKEQQDENGELEDPAYADSCRWHEHKDHRELACVRWLSREFRSA